MKNLKDISVILFCAVMIALSARISIENIFSGFLNIPGTAQSMMVLILALTVRSTLANFGVVLYLLMGICYLPVFANGASGYQIILGVSGGFLIGFLVASVVLGYLRKLNHENDLFHHLLLMILGTIIILLCGVIQLSFLKSFDIAMKYGLEPFIPGAIIKIILGAGIVWLFKHYLREARD